MNKKIIGILIIINLFLLSVLSTSSISSSKIDNSDKILENMDIKFNNQDEETQYWALIVDVGYNVSAEITKTVLCNNGWKENHIKILNGSLATKNKLFNAIEWLKERIDYNDIPILWFTCHGGNGTLALWDTYITYEELNKELNNIISNRMGIFIEACRSGSAISRISKNGRIIVTSCKENELTGTVFHICLGALQGYGDYFGNNNGKISFEEMFDFLSTHKDNLGHTPQIDDKIPGELDFSFLDESDLNPDQFPKLFGDDHAPITNKISSAQSFKPSFNKINKVKLFISKKGHPNPLIVSIRKNLTDDDLTSIIIPQDYISSMAYPFVGYDFYFPEINITPGDIYYIVCRIEGNFSNDDGYFLNIAYNIGENNSYEEGNEFQYIPNEGWIKYNDSDLSFITFNYIDEKPPEINIIKPDKGFYFFNLKILPRFFLPTKIIGPITIEVDATDEESSIKRVEFYINGKYMGNDSTKPYSYDWRWTRPRLFHWFIIKVVAYDFFNNNAVDKILVRKLL